ncbi:30S ribosomal protein S12 methylthiotransferase accessory factor YcaO [Avibacterium paragallinarum]|uniref:30S ribosomal protein S12 methylthiotransferase accessory factor YcaO n=3 Tax=Avibacterium paragallinarum TaxID=728 RepID=A0AAE5TJL9_AVIPA|nr:30S ribosomal protein S12 methylthiotransferase accessory factor YcaO [Avibacterium paragallinarum]MEE3609284.1 30S ribosomal protein S12 methylthiotransferase accessory factor YcaO [Avibacterium paragallinarum]MEE3620830.1 30S ribosomal protein S12 methylthiotransferase accessory factor YcaO [Avibacterium paragallinarum]MEE3669036.1 30S ribosomal protein S12 methylthiotransferase accessory factor YcaO [Avibacterium paragallinarum]MEE3681633.1 30S ribosomal protein S12 methylthiotransferase 
MTEQTFIPGKDAALEDSIAKFQQKLTALGFDIEEASWLNPVPNVWSVHIRDKDCPQCFTNGKGASKKAALASALGEYFERLSTNYFFADYYLGQDLANAPFVHYPNEKWFEIEDETELPEGILDEHLLAYYDPNGELTPDLLIDLQSGNAERGIVAMPYVRQSDNQTVYIPQSIIANLYVSNGMSAGNSLFEARVQGLSEVFERYVKNKIIAEAISLPLIPQDVMDHYPAVQEAIATLEQEGFPILAYDASLGGEYPVICVVLLNPQNGTCFASFGAHPNFGVALERTVTELLQGRSLKDLDVFTPPSFNNDDVAEHANLETHFIDSSGLISWDLFKQNSDYPFVDWDFSGTTEQEYQNLMAIFQALNQEVYIMDYQHLGVYACRIIVPGMSDIYPADDLIYANNNMGMDWREILLDLPHFHHDQNTYQELLDELDEQGIDDATRVREFIGIVPPPKSGWTTLRIGELKAMLYLATQDLENALDWVNWTLNMNQSVFTPERANYYRCLVNSLELFLDENRDPAQYRAVFEKMYGKSAVEFAWNAIQGGNPFYDLLADDEHLQQFHAHQKLLNAYHKLQKAKTDYWQSAV